MNYSFNTPINLMESATLGRRFLAFIIDLLVFNIVFFNLFMLSFQLTSGYRSALFTADYINNHPEIVGITLGLIAASSIIFCFYLSLSQFYFGTTVGMMITNLRVTGFINIHQLIIRNLFNSLLIFLAPFDFIGLPLFGDRLIDRLLGVKVLYYDKLRFMEELI